MDGIFYSGDRSWARVRLKGWPQVVSVRAGGSVAGWVLMGSIFRVRHAPVGEVGLGHIQFHTSPFFDILTCIQHGFVPLSGR